MHYDKPLAGCIALSTMMPEKQLPDPAGIVNKDIPYFQAHGETDDILPLSHGLTTSKILKQFLPNHEVSTTTPALTLLHTALLSVQNLLLSTRVHRQGVKRRQEVHREGGRTLS